MKCKIYRTIDGGDSITHLKSHLEIWNRAPPAPLAVLLCPSLFYLDAGVRTGFVVLRLRRGTAGQARTKVLALSQEFFDPRKKILKFPGRFTFDFRQPRNLIGVLFLFAYIIHPPVF